MVIATVVTGQRGNRQGIGMRNLEIGFWPKKNKKQKTLEIGKE